ncbi:fungal hydrophobin [Cylindrobasidium torrendii FP15055 ss-10]|uniref:Hydrophobin n=1 Tax=Cylindrobasidium torrendii FP15055 ss-10 TaxID=1314674 RepID=A0A0D7AWR9_9AGAR|nr:fungal hydrophobin [Cylindrobasidium torrendii FP15055 ss-10]
MKFFAALVALPLLVSATAVPRTGGGSCSTGQQSCCQQTIDAPTYWASHGILAALLGIDIGAVVGQVVGLNCSPILGNVCSARSVCCNAEQHGLINIGCIPIQL